MFNAWPASVTVGEYDKFNKGGPQLPLKVYLFQLVLLRLHPDVQPVLAHGSYRCWYYPMKWHWSSLTVNAELTRALLSQDTSGSNSGESYKM